MTQLPQEYNHQIGKKYKIMENVKVHETEVQWNYDYIINCTMDSLKILAILFVLYHLIILYRKLIKYLDKNS